MIDFGYSLIVKDDEIVDDAAGSVYYVAPEILDDRKKYTFYLMIAPHRNLIEWMNQ
jgi:hypothetical protein